MAWVVLVLFGFALVSHFCSEACGCGRTLFFFSRYIFFVVVALLFDHGIKFVKRNKVMIWFLLF
jgi:hypothetical protein